MSQTSESGAAKESLATPAIQGFALGPFATNCYVIQAPESRACWIVDASFQPDPLIEFVRGKALNPELIILTHAHIDHIAGLDMVRRAFPTLASGEPVPVIIHEDEASWLTDPVLNLSASHGELITTRPAERTLRGGETLTLGDTTWRVLHTPGHSPGGITLVHDESHSAIAGDTLFAGSIGRFDFPTSNEADLFTSIKQTLYALPGETVVYPGHGPTTTIARERATNPFVRAD